MVKYIIYKYIPFDINTGRGDILAKDREDALGDPLLEYNLTQEEFAEFRPVDLYNGQPFQEEIYDWGIVKKKKSVLKEK